jgi:hypothetical protein
MIDRGCSASGTQTGRRITDGPLRSLLFCPGHNDRRMHKAMAAGADAVILDLEGSVHSKAKDEAPALVAKVLAGEGRCRW